MSKSSSSVTPATKLLAAISSVDLKPLRHRVAHTAISGHATGSFVGREIQPLGCSCHVVLQTANSLRVPGALRLVSRTYVAGFGRDVDEVAIGTAGLNTTAFDLSGECGREFPKNNSSLAAAILRMLPELGRSETMDPSQGLCLPRFYVQFSPEAMRVPTPGRAIHELSDDIRRGFIEPQCATSPVDGMVESWRQDVTVPEFGWAVIKDAQGGQHNVLLPTLANFYVAVGDMVTAGQSLASLEGISPASMTVMAWAEAKVSLPGQTGEFLPLEFARPLLRQGSVPVLVVEDMRPLLSVMGVTSEAAAVRSATKCDLPAAELGVRAQRVLDAYRHRLGELSQFVSDASLMASLDAPEDQPLMLDGMAGTQVWHSECLADMRFRDERGIYVNFGSMRNNFIRAIGPADYVAPLTVSSEMKILEAAQQVAARMPGAASVIRQATGQLPEVAGMVDLLDKFGGNGAAGRYIEERRHALEEAHH